MTLDRLWRRFRGLLGTTIVWASAYALVGLGIGAWFWGSGETFLGFGGPAWLMVWAEGLAIAGAISGGVFSLAVMALERCGNFSAITPFRFGILGAIPAGTVMAIMAAPQSILYGSIGGAMGLICGGCSVILARRALLPPPSVRSIPPA